MTIKQIKNSRRNTYNELAVNFKAAIKAAYPTIEIEYSAPGPRGHDANCDCNKYANGWYLTVPSGVYSSTRHYHSAGHGILAVEDGRQRTNTKPLFLLVGWAYNGDYHSVKRTYWLFGQNEDDSYFLHKIRPAAGKTADLDHVRAWMWSIKSGERIKKRQGDLAFIVKVNGKEPRGKIMPATEEVIIGNHKVEGDKFKKTSRRIFVLNPRAVHDEHGTTSRAHGWFEMRLARQWELGVGD